VAPQATFSSLRWARSFSRIDLAEVIATSARAISLRCFLIGHARRRRHSDLHRALRCLERGSSGRDAAVVTGVLALAPLYFGWFEQAVLNPTRLAIHDPHIGLLRDTGWTAGSFPLPPIRCACSAPSRSSRCSGLAGPARPEPMPRVGTSAGI
jgi:hypothetical protein